MDFPRLIRRIKPVVQCGKKWGQTLWRMTLDIAYTLFAKVRAWLAPVFGLRGPLSVKWLASVLCVGFLFATLLGMVVHAMIGEKNLIHVTVNGHTISAFAKGKTVQESLAYLGYSVDPYDTIAPHPKTIVVNQMKIKLQKALCVYVQCGSQTSAIRLPVGSNVAEAVAKAGYIVDRDDELSVSPTMRLIGGELITYTRVDIMKQSQDELVDFDTVVQKSSTLLEGTSQVSTPGKEGVATTDYQVTLRNGKIHDLTVLGKRVTRPVINRIVLEGTRPKPVVHAKPKPKPVKAVTTIAKPTVKNITKGKASITSNSITVSGVTYRYKKKISSRVTAYTYTGHNTSSGLWPEVGMVAVVAKQFAPGTRFYIPGYGICVARDNGGGGMNRHNGYWIDVFMESRSECLAWGMRQLNVYVLE